ncbi:aspartic proteinase 39-like [Cicer arietinum]|uniref:aspartic proteinase 39-like n=1 Tax=Cicer arietinum TaxID=3827 RepID=UPI003CC5B95F
MDLGVDKFPLVSFNFAGGTSMDVKSAQYLVQSDFMNVGLCCIGFQKVESGHQILGDLVLKDKIVVYDLANQQIGWTNYNCSMHVNVSVTVSKDKNNNPRAKQSSSIISSELGILSKLLPVIIVALFMHTI